MIDNTRKKIEKHTKIILLHSCHSTVQMNATLHHVFSGMYVYEYVYVFLGGLIGLAGRGGGPGRF